MGITKLLIISLAMLLISAVMASAAPPECNDRIDNDGDGYIDFPADPGCEKRSGNELNPSVQCDDGVDNDGDGSSDSLDAGCSSPTDNDESNCGDGVCEGSETTSTCTADCGFADSCTDTDSSNAYTQGTTSGYLNNVPYSSNDYCIDLGNVNEYVCAGDYQQTQAINCGTDASEDVCAFGDVYTNSTDYFCNAGACGASNSLTLTESCEFGCTAGACDPAPDSCTDSDGFDVYTASSTSGYLNNAAYTNTDACIDADTVTEYYCSGTQSQSSNVNCGIDETYSFCSGGNVWTNDTQSGCISGACVVTNDVALTETCQYGCTAGTCDAAPLLPNLVATNMWFTETQDNETSPVQVTFRAYVNNTGDAGAGPSLTYFNGVYWLAAATGSLAPGQSELEAVSYPCTEAHTMTVTADATLQVAESNEQDNSASLYVDCIV